MDKIKLLESKKILKELEYVETDFEYKNFYHKNKSHQNDYVDCPQKN